MGSGTPEKEPLRVVFKQVRNASNVITDSNALEKLKQRRADSKSTRGPGGRPATVSDRTILTLLLLLAVNHEPLLLTTATKLVRTGLRDESLRYLDIAGFNRLPEAAVYHRLSRALQRLMAPLDAFPGPKRRRLSYDQMMAVREARDLDEVEELNDAMHEFVNDLVASSVLANDRDLIAHAQGNVAFDGTFVDAGGKRATDDRYGRYASSEYDAGRYYREGNHTGDDLDAKTRKVTKNRWGYDLTLATLADNATVHRDGTVTLEKVPHVVLGVAFDGSARDPGRNAVRALSNLPRHHLPVKYGIGDRAYYANATVDNFHRAVAAMGFLPVTDYKVNQLGRTESYRGAVQVEGGWYCECMPQGLVDATKENRAGLLDDTTYAKRIAARRQYAATRKARPDADGTSRWSHPTGIEHRCDKNRPNADLFCTQATISIPSTAGEKFAQELQYQSPEWKAVYGLRQTVESSNAGLKYEGTHVLGAKGRRRVRGRSAQFLLSALVVMARNFEILREFSRRLTDEEHARRIARAKELRRPTPYNSRSHDDDQREEHERRRTTETAITT